jgi:protocatechuate 3,4-dioxygenase beta subunit
MKNLQFLGISLCMTCSFMLPGAYNPLVAKTHQPMTSTRTFLTKCDPTPADYLGPFYKSDAPVRSSVGKGYSLEGVVMSSQDCSPIASARIELWLVNSDGSYDDDHRATVFSNDRGEYRFESNFPPGYFGRPPHIHIRLSANGFVTLATQHYPAEGQTSGKFDIVLVPIGSEP